MSDSEPGARALDTLDADLERASRPQAPTSVRMRVCDVCGQTYDLSVLADAVHHDDQPHQPTGN